MAEKNKSWFEGAINAGKEIGSKLASPDTWQEISEKVAKENEAFDKEVEELRKKHPSQGNFEKAVQRKIQDAYDEETKNRWRGVLMAKYAPKKEKAGNKNNNITQSQADNTAPNNSSKAGNNITQSQTDNTQIDNNTTEEKPKNTLKEDINTIKNKITEGASGVGNKIIEGVKNNTDDTTNTGNTTTGDTTNTGDTTTITPPETTLTKESAWNDYNKTEGTAKGLFESFNTLGMTAEEARKEFLSKVTTPSDAAKKAFKEIYGVDLIITDDGKDDGKDDDKDKKYKSSMYGIIDAMKNKDIDVPTGIYFMLDALSKAARNTGIDIGNIGAQFSGGTVRDDYQDSLWNQRRSKMFENEMTSELNKQEGTDKELEYQTGLENLKKLGFENEQSNRMLEASRKLADTAKRFREKGNETLANLYDAISSSAASGKIDVEEIASIASAGILDSEEGQEVLKDLKETLYTVTTTVTNTLSGVNETVEAFNNGMKDVMSWIGDKLKINNRRK